MMSNFIDAIERTGFNFSDNYVSGLESMVMTSDEAADKMIDLFTSAIEKGYHPEEVELEIYRQVDPSLLLPNDKERVQRKIQEIWNSKGAYYA